MKTENYVLDSKSAHETQVDVLSQHAAQASEVRYGY